MSAVYQGFSNKSKMTIVIISAFGAIINLGLAWYIVNPEKPNYFPKIGTLEAI